MDFRPNRRSIRLQGSDYSRAGAYLVSICTKERKCLFGDIENQAMAMNAAGRMSDKWYVELENKFKDIRCDEYIIMPNHLHAIIQNIGFVGADLCVCPDDHRHGRTSGEHIGSPLHYEHILRSENEMSRIREYIRNNPAQWATDKDYPFIEDKYSSP
jgi:REP element-mobilizing transposase RayT